MLRLPGTKAVLIRRTLALMANGALGMLYPPTCIACHCAVGDPHRLCAACWAGMRLIERPYCERLGIPFDMDLGGPLLSPAAIADPPVFGRARAVAEYEGTARALVHRLKYGDRLDLARALGAMMARAGSELLDEADLVVPVPLHWRRLWQRRFNQAATLGHVLARRAGIAFDPLILARVKPTRPQVGLSRSQRRENLQGAFRVTDDARPKLARKRVLLVDDVLTTGSTANAAARVLLRAGAASVDVLAFARVVKDGS
jgi:ComF family protein